MSTSPLGIHASVHDGHYIVSIARRAQLDQVTQSMLEELSLDRPYCQLAVSVGITVGVGKATGAPRRRRSRRLTTTVSSHRSMGRRVSVSIDHDTPVFAVTSIEAW